MLLLIDKPKGMTSHDVVYQVRKITGEKKVGHGGTLDPNATGLLIVGITRGGTKQLGEFTKGKDKEYEAEIFLGEERSTGDVEGNITQRSTVKNQNRPSLQIVKNTLSTFLGEQQQVPPIHSAIKIKGKKAYEFARKGAFVSLGPRNIHIYSLEILNYDYPVLGIRTMVSSGTYIRALARDIGRELGTYGYLNELRRTKIGDYDISEAVPLNVLSSDNWKGFIIDLD